MRDDQTPEAKTIRVPEEIDPSGRRSLHISRRAREHYGLSAELFGLSGRVLFADMAAARQLALALNAERTRAGRRDFLSSAELYASGLLDELYHLAFALYRKKIDPDLFENACELAESRLLEGALAATLSCFVDAFPPPVVYRDELSAEDYLSVREYELAALEELFVLNLANDNPALDSLSELFDDTDLAKESAYTSLCAELAQVFEQAPGFPGSGAENLLAFLLAPRRLHPDSILDQLTYIRATWPEVLGERFSGFLSELLSTLDVLQEEAVQRGGGAGGPPPAKVIDPDSHLDSGLAGRSGLKVEHYERFSPDSSWMPRVVMVAKSSYVWLDQLSKRYSRDISRLDQIPDEELDALAEAGFTGMWLIGLWERSEASRRIKHLRGDPEAVASAYALFDYVIADDLGGWSAYENLRNRAWTRGIRLASDMVPNHVGIDGRWVMEHPDWFIQTDAPPYPNYSFDGPDLSSDERVGVFIEDHYYDSSDAAVVFKRLDRHSGAETYIYHGNDGTTMPWNDTAQLDYLKAEVREAVIQTILHVARLFPIIRFDAAMTLAKQHVQRLWYPEPGSGGAIPSRSRYAMSSAEFEALMPQEFWREVVDRVAAEVPDTLLLAEAFWMMESYFVRTLGMHRVYNSAFMNMLKNEENAKYRESIKNVLEFDPQILKRFVNFMNNPDEETAIEQFGKNDKYFGVCTLLVTMPGLPMFGHGQVEGLTEKYGMEYRRAKFDEEPDLHLIERHRREIFPLLHRRAQFAEVDDFLLYDLYNAEGGVNEDVFVYSNLYQGQASLVLYNNKFSEARGWIRHSFPASSRGGRNPVALAAGLGLRAGQDDFVILREHVSGLEYLRESSVLEQMGLYVELKAFKYQVYLDIREVSDQDGRYRLVSEHLRGRGVESIADALAMQALAPLHEALSRLFTVLEAKPLTGVLRDDAEELAEHYRHAVEVAADFGLDAAPSAEEGIDALVAVSLLDLSELYEDTSLPFSEHLGPAATLIAYVLLSGFELKDGASPFDAWRLASLPEVREALDLDLLKCLDAHAEKLADLRQDGPADNMNAFANEFLASLMADERVRSYLQVHDHQDLRWYKKEPYRKLMAHLWLVGLLQAGQDGRLESLLQLMRRLEALELRSEYRFDALLAPTDEERPTAAEPDGAEPTHPEPEAEEDPGEEEV